MLCTKCGYKRASGAVCKKCGSPLLSKLEDDNVEVSSGSEEASQNQFINNMGQNLTPGAVPSNTGEVISQNTSNVTDSDFGLGVEVPNDFRFSDDQDDVVEDNPLENANIPVRHIKTQTRLTKKKNTRRMQKRMLYIISRIMIALLIAVVIYIIIDKIIAPRFFVFV